MTLARIFNLVRESFDGNEERDYTKIGVRHAIVLLCIPMVLEMGMEAVFALVDIFFVSKLGKEAIATVGLTEGVMMLVYSLAWGLGMGITALVARRVGEKDPKGASRAAMQGSGSARSSRRRERLHCGRRNSRVGSALSDRCPAMVCRCKAAASCWATPARPPP